MHDLEPHYKWRDLYIASKDKQSPFLGRESNQFQFTNKVYNYFIHPEWDTFGSQTLYVKQLYVDYSKGYAILELIGEWNDCLYNDIMFLKREVIEPLIAHDIKHFVLLCEHVLSFHASDDAYYEEWREEIMDIDSDGWIALLDVRQHVEEELTEARLQYYLTFGGQYNDINWRKLKPKDLYQLVHLMVTGELLRLS